MYSSLSHRSAWDDSFSKHTESSLCSTLSFWNLLLFFFSCSSLFHHCSADLQFYHDTDWELSACKTLTSLLMLYTINERNVSFLVMMTRTSHIPAWSHWQRLHLSCNLSVTLNSSRTAKSVNEIKEAWVWSWSTAIITCLSDCAHKDLAIVSFWWRDLNMMIFLFAVNQKERSVSNLLQKSQREDSGSSSSSWRDFTDEHLQETLWRLDQH